MSDAVIEDDMRDGLIAQLFARLNNVTPNPQFLKVPHWYISGSTGSNRNSGDTAGSPVADFGEVLRRWGTNQPINLQNTVVEWLDDDGLIDADTKPYVFAPIMPQGPGDGLLLNLYGSKIVVSSGVLGGVTAMSVGAGTLLLADLGSSAATAVGMILVNETRNAVCWVDSIISGNICALTQPAGPSVTTPPAWWLGGGGGPPLVNNFTMGDEFTIYRLPRVKFGAVLPTTVGFWKPTFDGMLCMMGNLWVPDLTGGFSESFLKNPTLRMTECRCDALVETQSPASNGVGEQIFNCWLPAGGLFAQEGIYAGAVGTNDSFIVQVSGGTLDANLIIHATNGFVISHASGGVNALQTIGGVFLFGNMRPSGNVWITANGAQYGLAHISGIYTIGDTSPTTGTVYHNGQAADVFQGSSTLKANGLTTALAVDSSSGAFHPGRALNPGQLDTAIAGGGFGGNAYAPNLNLLYSAV